MRLKQQALFLIVLISSAGVFAYRKGAAIHSANFNWGRLLQAMASTRISLIVASMAVVYVAYALRALRWKRFARFVGPSKFLPVYSAFLMGFSAIFLLGRPGEPVPPLLLAHKNRLPSSSMFGVYVLERLFDLAATAVLAGVGLFCFPGLLTGGQNQAWGIMIRRAGGALLLSLLGLIVLLIYFRLHGARLAGRYLAGWCTAGGWRRRFATQLRGFSDGLQAVRTFSDLLVVGLYTTLHWVLIALTFLMVVRSFGGLLASFSFASAAVVLSFTMVGSTLQFPGIGGGAQVATFIALTRIFGVQQEPAAAAAILIWLVVFASPCGVGVPLLIREGWSIGALRRLGHSERHELGTELAQ